MTTKINRFRPRMAQLAKSNILLFYLIKLFNWQSICLRNDNFIPPYLQEELSSYTVEVRLNICVSVVSLNPREPVMVAKSKFEKCTLYVRLNEQYIINTRSSKQNNKYNDLLTGLLDKSDQVTQAMCFGSVHILIRIFIF